MAKCSRHYSTDLTLFKFLEQYFQRLEAPLAIQVWSRYMQLIKDFLLSSREFKTFYFSALRLVKKYNLRESM